MTKKQYEILNIISSFILSLVIVFLPFQYEDMIHAGKIYLYSPLIVPILVLFKGGKILKIIIFILKWILYFIFRFFKVKIKLKAIDWTFIRFPRVESFFSKLGDYLDINIEKLFLIWIEIGPIKRKLIVFFAWLPISVIIFFIMISYSATIRRFIFNYIMAFWTEYHFEKQQKKKS